jgi:hypothetical protein
MRYPEQATRVSLTQLAKLTGLSKARTRRYVVKFAWIADPVGDPPTFDARLVDVVQAMRGLPHRTLEPAHRDWLATYLKENPQ